MAKNFPVENLLPQISLESYTTTTGELPVAVDHCQLRTMASESVDPFDRPLPPTLHRVVPPMGSTPTPTQGSTRIARYKCGPQITRLAGDTGTRTHDHTNLRLRVNVEQRILMLLVAMRCLNPKPQCCTNAMPQCDASIRCLNAMPQCDASMRCTNAMHQCDAPMRCTNAMHQCDAPMKCTSAMHQCDAPMQCTSAIKQHSFR